MRSGTSSWAASGSCWSGRSSRAPGTRRGSRSSGTSREGTPTAYDRVLATRFGIEAIGAVSDGDYGKMVALNGSQIVRVPIGDGVGTLKTLDPQLYETAEVFFG